MPFVYGDSYGGLQAAKQAEVNSSNAYSLQLMSLIAGMRQQEQQNSRFERQFRAEQEGLITDLARKQQQFDIEKDLAYKGMAVKDAALEFEKTKEAAMAKRAEDMLLFRRSELDANTKFADTQRKDQQSETTFADAMDEAESGVLFDPFDAEQSFPDLDTKKRDVVVRRSKQVYEEQANQYKMAEAIAKTFNAQMSLEQKINEYGPDSMWNNARHTAEEKKAQANRKIALDQLKGITAKYKDKKFQTLVAFDEESGQYIPLAKQPKTFREMYPDRVQSQGMGRVREVDSEAAPTELDLSPQSYDEATGAVGLPFTPPVGSRPMQDPMVAAGLTVPQGVDPRAQLVAEFMSRGMPLDQAIVMADNAMQGQAAQRQFSSGRYRP